MNAPRPERDADEIQELVGGYVDRYRETHGGNPPPRQFRAAAGRSAKRLLADGYPARDLAVCLRVIAEENKNPGALAHVLADLHAERARRAG